MPLAMRRAGRCRAAWYRLIVKRMSLRSAAAGRPRANVWLEARDVWAMTRARRSGQEPGLRGRLPGEELACLAECLGAVLVASRPCRVRGTSEGLDGVIFLVRL